MEPTAGTKFIDRIREYIKDKKYISFDALKKYLERYGKIKDNTLYNALYRLKKESVIFDSGRGYYSTIEDTIVLDVEYIDKIQKAIRESFPFLNFYIWSTEQIKFAFHHQLSKHITFIYSDKENLSSLKNSLETQGYFVFENPTTKLERDKYVNLIKDAIILRPKITRVETKNHIPAIENILVDLYLEAERLDLIEKEEYNKVFQYFLQNFRIRLGYIIDYAKRRKIDRKINELIEMHSIDTTAY